MINYYYARYRAFRLYCDYDVWWQSMLLGKQGQTLRAIAAAAKQQLMNVFHREMSLKLTVRTPGGRVSKLKTSANDAESRTHLQQKHTNVWQIKSFIFEMFIEKIEAIV